MRARGHPTLCRILMRLEALMCSFFLFFRKKKFPETCVRLCSYVLTSCISCTLNIELHGVYRLVLGCSSRSYGSARTPNSAYSHGAGDGFGLCRDVDSNNLWRPNRTSTLHSTTFDGRSEFPIGHGEADHRTHRISMTHQVRGPRLDRTRTWKGSVNSDVRSFMTSVLHFIGALGDDQATFGHWNLAPRFVST